jgi:UDP-glucose 4-epimerase
MIENNVMKIVFSSTAATYGEPEYIPIDEKHPQNPINPYGRTKLMIENIMDDYDSAYGLKSVRLRYFNVAGADTK